MSDKLVKTSAIIGVVQVEANVQEELQTLQLRP